LRAGAAWPADGATGGAAFAAGAAGAVLAAGTVTMVLQSGHGPFLPAISSLTVNARLQLGHWNLIGMIRKTRGAQRLSLRQ
jgi:hypothetical protein